ncbi:MAG: triose-phosphate isomerase [Gammaproteobacteria bacterium]|nr:triose-phosphate isomerase [Gammaproteobacteria bacterium]
MRRSLVAGNWKMHGSRESIADLLQALIRESGLGVDGVDLVVCPPLPYLQMCQQLLSGSVWQLGAQNVHSQPCGAYTGEVAAPMLAEFSVRYVLVGHSERRQLARETDALVAEKFSAVLRHAMRPILCLGETLEQRESGRAEEVVAAQLNTVLEHSGVSAMADAVIAYEPVWAIGTGCTASAGQAQEMHRFIRELMARRSAKVASQIRIIYGGSVNAGNARELFAQSDIDGGLVGGASLKADEFITICKSVS